jgi:hypothetical protein
MKRLSHMGMEAVCLLGLILFLTGCASAPAERSEGTGPYFATVKSVHGNVQWAHGGGNWTPLPAHARIYKDDQIKTSVNSRADLAFGKFGGKMEVPPESEIAIDEFGPSRARPGETTVIVRARQGHVKGNTLDLPETTKFYIRTDAGDLQVK